MKLSKTMKVVIVELGMLGGILVSAYTLPGETPLKTLLIASLAVFFLGNVLLIRKLRTNSDMTPMKRDARPHILRAAIILAVGWALVLLLRRA
jgi:hypothetical protein